jgi:hypothetical protein
MIHCVECQMECIYSYKRRTVVPSTRSALVPNSSWASSTVMTRNSRSVGKRAATASAPFATLMPVDVMVSRSGTDSGSSETTKTVPLSKNRLSNIVQPSIQESVINRVGKQTTHQGHGKLRSLTVLAWGPTLHSCANALIRWSGLGRPAKQT